MSDDAWFLLIGLLVALAVVWLVRRVLRKGTVPDRQTILAYALMVGVGVADAVFVVAWNLVVMAVAGLLGFVIAYWQFRRRLRVVPPEDPATGPE